MDVRTETLTSWEQIASFRRHGWIFRGQSDASRLLRTSLEICFDRQQIPTAFRTVVEKELLREFKRAYQQYSLHVPSDQCTLEWLSLMRHHGAPTRLLDFSYSIYVAAYFALEDAEEECAIWAVNLSWAFDETLRLLKAARKECRMLETQRLEGLEENHEADVARIFLDPPFVPSACPLNPFRLNERLRLQMGIFLIPGDITIPFEANLGALRGHDDVKNMVRIVIPRALQAGAIEHLYYMNITRTSLFPGLDGYSRSLRIYHPIFNPQEWGGSG
jgi:hypothetical protein